MTYIISLYSAISERQLNRKSVISENQLYQISNIRAATKSEYQSHLDDSSIREKMANPVSRDNLHNCKSSSRIFYQNNPQKNGKMVSGLKRTPLLKTRQGLSPESCQNMKETGLITRLGERQSWIYSGWIGVTNQSDPDQLKT